MILFIGPSVIGAFERCLVPRCVGPNSCVTSRGYCDFMKSKLARKFVCSDCAATHLSWLGRCPSCGSWNSIEEAVEVSDTFDMRFGGELVAYEPSALLESRFIPSSFAEFDAALSGGVVLGSTILIGGEPGIGKSTLALQVAASFTRQGYVVLYVSAEESVAQIQSRAYRLGIGPGNLELLHGVELSDVIGKIEKFDLVVIDSVQAIGDSNHAGLIGSVNQVRHCAQRLNELAKALGKTIIMLSHVTKDGSIAGPKLLEHLVDTVLMVEGERGAQSRSVRCLKNRFGKVSEVGYLTMSEVGFADEPDPTELFVADRLVDAPGSVVSATRDGNRIRLVEVQVLAVPNTRDVPRRQFLGVNSQRCLVILGMIEHFGQIRLDKHDIFVSVAGGASFEDPGLDLAIAISVVSGVLRTPLPSKFACFGELGLTGEIRNVPGATERADELARRGFSSVLSPISGSNTGGKTIKSLSSALEACGLKKEIRPANC